MNDVKTLLGTAFDDEPPLGFHRDDVVRKGRARLRQRRVAGTGGAVVGLVAVLFGASVLTAPGSAAPPASSQGPTCAPQAGTDSCGTFPLTTTAPGLVVLHLVDAGVDEALSATPVRLASPVPAAQDRAYLLRRTDGSYEVLRITSGADVATGIEPTCAPPTTCETRTERVKEQSSADKTAAAPRWTDREVVIARTPNAGTSVYVRHEDGTQLRVGSSDITTVENGSGEHVTDWKPLSDAKLVKLVTMNGL